MKLYYKIKEFQYLLKNNWNSKTEKTKPKQIIEEEREEINPETYKRHFISKNLSKEVKKRDENCFICGTKLNLQAHHIFGVKEYPFLAIYPENVITLCSKCHDEYHQKYTEINCITWSKFLREQGFTRIKEVYPSKEELINNDAKGTILHVIRHEQGKRISHGKLVSIMKTKYHVPYTTTEDLIRELVNRRTLKEYGGEYCMK